MSKGIKALWLLLGMVFFFPAFFSPEVFSQEAPAAAEDQGGAADAKTIPDALRRPERGEAPRYPQDLVIGKLGQGDAPEGAYLFALGLIQTLTAGSKDAPVLAASSAVLTESVLAEIADLAPRSYRIGGGRTEADGTVSFLIRFLGPDDSMTGELFVRQAEDHSADQTKDQSTDQTKEQTTDQTKDQSSDQTKDVSQGTASAQWFLDDLTLEDKRPLSDIKDTYRYDFSPYERFY